MSGLHFLLLFFVPLVSLWRYAAVHVIFMIFSLSSLIIFRHYLINYLVIYWFSHLYFSFSQSLVDFIFSSWSFVTAIQSFITISCSCSMYAGLYFNLLEMLTITNFKILLVYSVISCLFSLLIHLWHRICTVLVMVWDVIFLRWFSPKLWVRTTSSCSELDSLLPISHPWGVPYSPTPSPSSWPLLSP